MEMENNGIMIAIINEHGVMRRDKDERYTYYTYLDVDSPRKPRPLRDVLWRASQLGIELRPNGLGELLVSGSDTDVEKLLPHIVVHRDGIIEALSPLKGYVEERPADLVLLESHRFDGGARLDIYGDRDGVWSHCIDDSGSTWRRATAEERAMANSSKS